MILLERPERARWVKADHRMSAPGLKSGLSRVMCALRNTRGSGWEPQPSKARDLAPERLRVVKVRRGHALPAQHPDTTNSAGSMKGTAFHGRNPRRFPC
jgi:hypothetical protein